METFYIKNKDNRPVVVVVFESLKIENKNYIFYNFNLIPKIIESSTQKSCKKRHHLDANESVIRWKARKKAVDKYNKNKYKIHSHQLTERKYKEIDIMRDMLRKHVTSKVAKIIKDHLSNFSMIYDEKYLT